MQTLTIIDTRSCHHKLFRLSQQLLSDDELARAEAFILERDYEFYCIARTCLRLQLAHAIGVSAEDITLTRNPEGKPQLTPDLPFCEFNLSKSSPMLALALSDQGTVGVDIEYHHDTDNWQKLAKPSLHPDEYAAVEKVAKTENGAIKALRLYNQYWAAKEAYVKCLGLGLYYRTTEFLVSWDDCGRINIDDPKQTQRFCGQFYYANQDSLTKGNQSVDAPWVAAVVQPRDNTSNNCCFELSSQLASSETVNSPNKR